MATNTSDVSTGANEDGGGRYAPVNGLSVYYETHGSGRPLVLLHGGLYGDRPPHA